MQGYLNKPMAELAAQLAAGLLRLRKGYVDAAESLIEILDPLQEYPYEFIVYRLTGYRSRHSDPPAPMTGKALHLDLLRLMIDVSSSFDLAATEYPEETFDAQSLARKYSVSTKTVQRWRRRGLPCRRMVFGPSRRRIGFLTSSVERFIQHRRQEVLRSVHFSHMTPQQKQDLIRRARRMARFAECSLSDVVRRLAARTGRAVETIRYTLRRYDAQHPDDPIFAYLSQPLAKERKEIIYRCFLRGVSVQTLAANYRRTRGSIYRIINEMRAKQLLGRPIGYMYNPQFDLPGADDIILPALAAADEPPPMVQDEAQTPSSHVPAELPPYMAALYQVPLLGVQRERDLFRRFNYLKYKADRLRRQLDLNRILAGQLKQIEALLLQASAVKNEIIRANLRLVVSISRKHLRGPQTFFELVSDGNVSLMKAAEKFDYSRGNRFSTYASWAIMRNFARTVPQEQFQMDRFETGHDDTLDVASAMRSYDPNELNVPELRESIDVVLAQLSPRERTILIEHYGLGEEQSAKTLDQLGQNMGISKERVRQIEHVALQKLRGILHPRQADLLG